MFKKLFCLLLAGLMLIGGNMFTMESHAAACMEQGEDGEWTSWTTPGCVAGVLENEAIVDLMDEDSLIMYQGNVARIVFTEDDTFATHNANVACFKGGILKAASVGQTDVQVCRGEEEKTVAVTVLPSKTFTSDSYAEVEVDGTLDLVVRGEYNNRLTEGEDYVLTVDEAGLPEYYEFYVVGINDYTGSSWSGRRNVPADAFFESDSIEDANLATASLTSLEYTGDAIEPWVTLTLNGKELTEGEDFEVSYRDNVHVGTATILVDGKGAYNGHREVTFDIVKGTNELKAKSSITLKGTKAVKLAASDSFGAKLSYKSSNKNVVVSKDGKVQAKKKGSFKATITITAKGCSDYKKATKTVKVKVVKK